MLDYIYIELHPSHLITSASDQRTHTVMARANRLKIVLLVFSIFYIDTAKCYQRKKRATGGVPLILEDFESNENSTVSSEMIRLIETQTTSSTEMLSLLETQNQLLNQMVASLGILMKGTQLIAGDCSDIVSHGPYASGVYTITPWDDSRRRGSFRVYCDMETLGGGWTVVQKRFDGSVDFYRGWKDYRNGFGHIDGGEYWLGLSKLNRLTNTGLSWQLRVEIGDFEGNTAYAHYDNFSIGDESTSFQLTIGSYSGTAGDGLAHHAGMPFATKERDTYNRCAATYRGAWWYNTGGGCLHSNLNSVYKESEQNHSSAIIWYQWKNAWSTLKRSEMKIRPIHA